jgi:hypothetical protein
MHWQTFLPETITNGMSAIVASGAMTELERVPLLASARGTVLDS